MSAVKLDTVMMQELRNFGILDARNCFNCGSCAGICPLSQISGGFPRKLLRYGQLGLTDFNSEDTWTCATCRACVQQCPRGVEIIDFIQSIRRLVVQKDIGYMPKSLRTTMVNLAAVGNPFGEPPGKRALWAREMGVKRFSRDTDFLLFLDCYAGYDPVVKKSAVSLIRLLDMAGVSYGILGEQEICCGESAKKAGNETVYRQLAEKNIEMFNTCGVRSVIAVSPHCYHTFKNEYPGLGAHFEVLHYTQLLADLLGTGKLKPVKPLEKVVTYHDPCYLGRYNNVYQEPRQIIKSIPGIELREMPLSGHNSFCCGGGGGKIWMEAKKGERLSDIRLQQAVNSGAGELILACPYCTVNLEDSKLSNNESIVVKDIASLLLEAILT
ncbi:MAG: (Fe-S)-binding protein [Chloroflexi bacterium]|nr:(Fe-S)-binding protein [Chloroflexota bacterium]